LNRALPYTPGFKKHLLSVHATKKTVLIDFPAQIISLSAVNFAAKTMLQHSHVIYQTKATGVLYTY
jgi:hypothetical protein